VRDEVMSTNEKPAVVPGQATRGWLITLTAAASMVGIVLGSLRGPLAGTSDSLWPVSWLAWPLAGWMVLIRRPGNRIGMLCQAIGVTWGLAFGLQSMVLDVGPTVAPWVELAYTVLGVVPWLLIVTVLNTFPSGGYAGRAETLLGRAVVVVGVWALLGFLISPEPLVDTGLDNPLGVPELSLLTRITDESGFALIVLLALGALARLVIRGRRSSGVERQQFRWLMLGGSLFLVVTSAAQFVPEDSPAELVWFLGALGIPVSIGVAVIRYRLYEIDRILSRTIGYVLVVGSLAVVWVAAVTLLTSVMPAESPLAIAGSTLAVAALFNPLRRRVQDWVDRRFNRSRYDAQRVLDHLSASMRDEIDPESVREQWLGAVVGTMQPASVAVWVKGRT
jgi:hypothetical protein